MPSRTRKSYDAEFKRQAVTLADTTERSDAVVERELGLYQGAIRHWRAELNEHTADAFPGAGHMHASDEELRQLRRENEILRQERDILKKAVVIFSKPPSTGTGS
ncbi:MAG: transposase [Ignavibacteria bacterium]|nr:transposase [Ignavibacteria bacterium]